MTNLKRWQFYLLSFTWGLPMSIVGCLVCGVLMCLGYKPKRYGHAFYIPIGKKWGGVNFGWFFLVDGRDLESLKKHELGHGYQNACILGWIFPIFGLISAARYWFDRLIVPIDYYSWWFEAQANAIGGKVMKNEEARSD